MTPRSLSHSAGAGAPGDSSAVPLGSPAYFAEQATHGFYAARNGLFLIDPARLEAHLGRDVRDTQLLESFTRSGRGQEICAQGLVVPAFGVEAGFYTVLVRSTETEDAFTPLTHLVYATGFVLGTATGDLLVCNTDWLSRTEATRSAEDPELRRASPEQRAARPVHVTPGWYSVTVVAGIREEEGDGEGWVCAFLLDPQPAQPEFLGDLSKTLSFFAG